MSLTPEQRVEAVYVQLHALEAAARGRMNAARRNGDIVGTTEHELDVDNLTLIRKHVEALTGIPYRRRAPKSGRPKVGEAA